MNDFEQWMFMNFLKHVRSEIKVLKRGLLCISFLILSKILKFILQKTHKVFDWHLRSSIEIVNKTVTLAFTVTWWFKNWQVNVKNGHVTLMNDHVKGERWTVKTAKNEWHLRSKTVKEQRQLFHFLRLPQYNL